MTSDALAARTLALVDIPSESHDEAEIERYVAEAVPREPAYAEDSALFYPPRNDGPFVLLAGHLDTVPAQGNLPGRIEDGAVHGLGASDMKGGVAVMVELAQRSELDAGFLFFGREELPAEQSPLGGFFAACPRVREAVLAIVLEPTDNTIQAGCLGNLDARLVFHGRSAHSARPWLGENAIAAALRGLAPIVELEPRDVEIDGLVFREVLTVTTIRGGIATNVVPDRVEANVNFRYAPGTTPADAEAHVRRLAAGADVEIGGNSPPAKVVARTPLVDRLRAAGGFELEPKQAWTPVAQFTNAGIDAINLGPGATRYAHTRDERVEIAELVRTYEALSRFLGTV
ncbi:MAG TPA: succinyl-diaminopimelate desuccinylase [Gaiellaceae bacterium]